MRCVICKDVSVQMRGPYECCVGCGHKMRQVDGDLATWHEQNYRFSEKYDPREVTPEGKLTSFYHEARQRYTTERLTIIGRLLDDVHSLLDVGCGGGTFLRELVGRVPDLFGLEVAQDLVDACAEFGVQCARGDFMTWEPARTWEAVCAFHVLEHVRDPLTFLGKMCALATKYVFLEIPCKGNTDRVFAGHVQSFSETSFKRLIESTGRESVILRHGATHKSVFAALGEKL